MSDQSKKMKEIERLQERRNVLDNNFGHGSFLDGLNRQKIEEIDRRLAELQHAQ